jgi:hypothetical protein
VVSAPATGSASERGARSGCDGTNPRASVRRARSRSSAPERVQRLRLAAAVEDDRRAADQRRQRGCDRVQPALAEHDALQALLHRDRSLQQRVLLVDQAGERLLGHRDERRVVRDLDQREVALGGGLNQRLGHLLVAEADAEAEAREAVVGQPRDVAALLVGRRQRQPGGEQQLTTGEPRGRVREL